MVLGFQNHFHKKRETLRFSFYFFIIFSDSNFHLAWLHLSVHFVWAARWIVVLSFLVDVAQPVVYAVHVVQVTFLLGAVVRLVPVVLPVQRPCAYKPFWKPRDDYNTYHAHAPFDNYDISCNKDGKGASRDDRPTSKRASRGASRVDNISISREMPREHIREHIHTLRMAMPTH